MTPRFLRRALAILSMAGWLLFGYITVATLTAGATGADVFQVDWRVYWAGAHDLLDRDLYRVPLDAGGATLSTPDFNLPPMSAAVVLPLLGLPITMGGYVWQTIGAISIAIAASAGVAIWRIRRPSLHAGLVAGPVSLTLFYVEGLHLGTNNYLVLALVAGFAWLYLRGSEAPAAVLLGFAIALKLWPAVLLVVAIRERRLHVAAWAIAVGAAATLALFAWIGPDAVPAFLRKLQTAIPATGYLIGPTAVPGLREMWNSGLGVGVGLALLVLPLRGPAGIGAAMIAGLCAIPNLWIHYGPTVLFAVALLAIGLVRRRSALGDERAITQEAPAGGQ